MGNDIVSQKIMLMFIAVTLNQLAFVLLNYFTRFLIYGSIIFCWTRIALEQSRARKDYK